MSHNRTAEHSIGIDGAESRSQQGSALVLALFLIIILGLLGTGLLTRSLLITRLAGSERWITKTFYAADSGLNAARARVRINQLAGFNFNLTDLRGAAGAQSAGNIEVAVAPLQNTGVPRLAVGSQLGGGQGGAEGLYVLFYRTESEAQQTLTRSRSIVSSILSVGPIPLTIPED